jgi:D-alanyl-D-alanine carboxypeptidase
VKDRLKKTTVDNNKETKKTFYKPEKRELYKALFMILVLGIIILVSLFATSRKEELSVPQTVAKENYFDNLNLEARAAFVWDINSQKVIFEKNADETLPLASLAKLMTAITAAKLLPEHTIITIDDISLQSEGDVGILSGEKFNLRDLINLSLLASSNDAVAAVSTAAGTVASGTNDGILGHQEFVKLMNDEARELGLPTLLFYNESGLDLNDQVSGAYGSARDLARLFEYALENYPELILPTRNEDLVFESINNILHKIKNTNTGIGEVPGILASKTGFTDLAGGNLAVVMDPSIGRPFVLVVLGSSYDGRFKDVENLSLATLQLLKDN